MGRGDFEACLGFLIDGWRTVLRVQRPELPAKQKPDRMNGHCGRDQSEKRDAEDPKGLRDPKRCLQRGRGTRSEFKCLHQSGPGLFGHEDCKAGKGDRRDCVHHRPERHRHNHEAKIYSCVHSVEKRCGKADRGCNSKDIATDFINPLDRMAEQSSRDDVVSGQRAKRQKRPAASKRDGTHQFLQHGECRVPRLHRVLPLDCRATRLPADDPFLSVADHLISRPRAAPIVSFQILEHSGKFASQASPHVGRITSSTEALSCARSASEGVTSVMSKGRYSSHSCPVEQATALPLFTRAISQYCSSSSAKAAVSSVCASSERLFQVSRFIRCVCTDQEIDSITRLSVTSGQLPVLPEVGDVIAHSATPRCNAG